MYRNTGRAEKEGAINEEKDEENAPLLAGHQDLAPNSDAARLRLDRPIVSKCKVQLQQLEPSALMYWYCHIWCIPGRSAWRSRAQLVPVKHCLMTTHTLAHMPPLCIMTQGWPDGVMPAPPQGVAVLHDSQIYEKCQSPSTTVAFPTHFFLSLRVTVALFSPSPFPTKTRTILSKD